MNIQQSKQYCMIITHSLHCRISLRTVSKAQKSRETVIAANFRIARIKRFRYRSASITFRSRLILCSLTSCHRPRACEKTGLVAVVYAAHRNTITSSTYTDAKHIYLFFVRLVLFYCTKLTKDIVLFCNHSFWRRWSLDSQENFVLAQRLSQVRDDESLNSAVDTDWHTDDVRSVSLLSLDPDPFRRQRTLSSFHKAFTWSSHDDIKLDVRSYIDLYPTDKGDRWSSS